MPQPLRELRSLFLRPRVQQRLYGEISLRRRVLYPSVEFVLGHVPFHDPGVIFFVRTLVKLPHVVASDLLLKAGAGPYLAAGLLRLSGRDIFAVQKFLSLNMEEPPPTQPALTRRVADPDRSAQLHIEKLSQALEGAMSSGLINRGRPNFSPSQFMIISNKAMSRGALIRSAKIPNRTAWSTR